jgi:hypothetical protein
MDITEVARRSGVRASTLRFYEEKGLMPLSAGGVCAVCSIPACWNGSR